MNLKTAKYKTKLKDSRNMTYNPNKYVLGLLLKCLILFSSPLFC